MGVDGAGHEDQQRHVAQFGQRDAVAARPRPGERDEQEDSRPCFDVSNWRGGAVGAESSRFVTCRHNETEARIDGKGLGRDTDLCSSYSQA